MHLIPPKDRYQTTFFTSLDSLVESNNPVRIIDAFVSIIIQNNPEKFQYRGLREVGRKAYSSSTYLKLFIYGYLNSIQSSRKLETETHRNIELKWLLGDLQPDHKSISDYRKHNSSQIKQIAIDFRRFLKSKDYIKGKKVAIDGTKVKAYSKRDMLTMKKIERRLSNLELELDRYIERLSRADIEDDIYDEIESLEPDAVHKQLIDKIAQLQTQVERLQEEKAILESSGKKQINTSDPDASLMKSLDGLIPAYNVQVVVDSEHKMIAESQVSTCPNDLNELKPIMEAMKKNLELEPKESVADKGYYNPEDIKELEDEGNTKYYIAPTKGYHDVEKVKFTYDKETDEYICSAGKRLVLKQKNKNKRGKLCAVYQGIECEGCPLRSQCTKSKYGRIVHRYHDQEWRDAYKERMKSKLGRQRISERKAIIEHVFGTLKYWMGKIPLLLRGKEGVQTEINLYTTAYNMKRLMNIERFEDIMYMINNYDWKMA